MIVKLIFSIVTAVFSVTWSFRNHSDIWCSRNIIINQNSCAFYFVETV